MVLNQAQFPGLAAIVKWGQENALKAITAAHETVAANLLNVTDVVWAAAFVMHERKK